MPCPQCKREVEEADGFCRGCGKNLKPGSTPRSDFELGRISALETVKEDIRKWLAIYAVIVTLAGGFGIHEFIKSRISTAVDERLGALEKKIEVASDKANEQTARATIRGEQLEQSVQTLGNRSKDVDSSLKGLQGKGARLETSIRGLDRQRVEMESAARDLQEKEKKLHDVIESENLATIFAKLRADLYRIRSLDAKIIVWLNRTDAVVFPAAQISLWKKDKGGNQDNVVQFQITEQDQPTFVETKDSSGKKVIAVLYRYKLFAPYESGLRNKNIDALDGITHMDLSYRQTFREGTHDDNAKLVRNYFNSIDKIEVEVAVNGIPWQVHSFPRAALLLPEEPEKLLVDNHFELNLSEDVTDSYRNATSSYESRISAEGSKAAQPKK